MIEVGVREFRANLPHFLAESDQPMAITRHGEVLGYFIPSKRRTPSEAQDVALLTAVARMREFVAEMGVDEDAVIANFKRARKAGNVPKPSNDLIAKANK